MRANAHHVGNLGAGQHRADRETAAQRLGQGDDVRGHTPVPVREQLTGTAHADLDFIQHQQRIVLVAQLTGAPHELGTGRHHPALALHRLEHHSGNIASGHRCFKLGDIVEIDIAEATGQRLVAFLVLRLGGSGDRGQGAAMEAATEGHNETLLRAPALCAGPLANQLDRHFIGFGAGIAQEHALGEARDVHQLLCQMQRRLAVEHVAGVPQLVGLLEQGSLQIRVVVAQAAHRDAGGQVDELATLRIPKSGALAALQHQLARAIHRQVVIGQGQQRLGDSSHGVQGHWV